MNMRLALSRRQIVFASLGAGFTLDRVRKRTNARLAQWKPDDGLRLAGPSQGVETLDPALVRDMPTIFITRQICRGLVGYDETLRPVPELAESIEQSDDGQEYTFRLRPDARFHDGRRIVANDVVFSLNRALDPATAGGDRSRLSGTTYLDDIDDISVYDDETVRITLSGPSSTFLMKLAAMPAAILDRHQSMGEPTWWHGINGSGPYRLTSFEEGSGLELEAVDSWRGESIAVQHVEMRLGLQASQPVNLFQDGAVDLVIDVPPSLVSLINDPASGIEEAFVLEKPEFGLSYIAFGNQDPPLNDLHVRRALQYVFPADRFARAAFDGRVRVAEGVVSPGMLGRDWPARIPEVDLAAARAELAASRYGDGMALPPIRIRAADIAPVEALRDVAKSALDIDIEAVQVDWFDFLEGLSSRAWDAYSLFWGADYPDPEALLGVLFGSESPENYTGYSNTAFDELLAAGEREHDDMSREEILMRAQQVLIDDAAVIPLYVPVQYTLARAGMAHVPITAMGLLGLERLS